MTNTLCSVADCTAQPFITHPLPLCRHDALTVSLNVTDRLHANALHSHSIRQDIDRATVSPDTVWAQPSHPDVVYFLANGDRVKIGTSTNITARVSALSFRRSNVLLLLDGSSDLENALHQHFEADRIGRTEWFVLSNRITNYINQRKRADAMLRQPVLPPEPTADASTASPTPRLTARLPARQKPATADTKILDVLLGHVGLYLHKDTIAQLTGLEGSTLDNALSRLVKADKIHRQQDGGKTIRGMYGHGPATTDQEDQDEAA